MTAHELKVHPPFFTALLDGSKPFVEDEDDRDPPFAVGDTLVLREWDPDVYTRHLALLLASSPLAVATNAGDDDELLEGLQDEARELAYTGRTLERRVTYVLPLKEWPAADTVLGLENTEQVQAQWALLHEYGNLQGRHAILLDERARIAAALGAGADSDLVSLATTLAAFYAAHAETVEDA